jgi:tetratricopeptide (TPR) repeat protein
MAGGPVTPRPGERVILRDLKSRPGLNGRTGIVLSYKAEKERFAVKVEDAVGESLLLKEANLERMMRPSAEEEEGDDCGLTLEANSDDDGGELTLEANHEDDDDGGLHLESNVDEDEDEDEGLTLEENGAAEEEDDGELTLEENDDGDELQLEENDDGDELALEDNDGGGLELEVNGDDYDDDSGLELEANDVGGGGGGGGVRGEGGVSWESGTTAFGHPSYEPQAAAPFYLGGGGMGSGGGGGGGGGGSFAYGSAHEGDGGGEGLAEALRALRSNGDGGGGETSAAFVGGETLSSVTDRFLIPSAKAKLEEAQQLHPRRPNESESAYMTRLTQLLTANHPEECFIDAARQIVEAYGVETIALRMRMVGDDHFAAGSYYSACHCYTAGILKHSDELGDRDHLMQCFVNRAASLLKLGEKERAVDDANAALEIAEGTFAPKTQRKALLRRAQALFELGRMDAAREDLERVGPNDAAARKLLEKLEGGGEAAGTTV